MSLDLLVRPPGRGWANFGNDRAKWHFIGPDNRSLCGKWADLTRNLLELELHPEFRCASCQRRFAKLINQQIKDGGLKWAFGVK